MILVNLFEDEGLKSKIIFIFHTIRVIVSICHCRFLCYSNGTQHKYSCSATGCQSGLIIPSMFTSALASLTLLRYHKDCCLYNTEMGFNCCGITFKKTVLATLNVNRSPNGDIGIFLTTYE